VLSGALGPLIVAMMWLLGRVMAAPHASPQARFPDLAAAPAAEAPV